jgi:hypothetical protein
MSTDQLINEIRTLSDSELQELLTRLFREDHIREEIERLGYLKLTEEAFAFWNDPREDIYQDYARNTREKL